MVGPLREDFFVETMLVLGHTVHYLKTARGAKTPDYLIPGPEGDIVIEVGGKGKGYQQFKGIDAEKKIILRMELKRQVCGGRYSWPG